MAEFSNRHLFIYVLYFTAIGYAKYDSDLQRPIRFECASLPTLVIHANILVGFDSGVQDYLSKVFSSQIPRENQVRRKKML